MIKYGVSVREARKLAKELYTVNGRNLGGNLSSATFVTRLEPLNLIADESELDMYIHVLPALLHGVYTNA